RALRVLCASADPEHLDELKRASVDAHWELVGGASTLGDLSTQVEGWRPDVVVIDQSMGPEAATRTRAAYPRARIVGVGRVIGADAEVESLDEVKGAIQGVPPPQGPVVR